MTNSKRMEGQRGKKDQEESQGAKSIYLLCDNLKVINCHIFKLLR